VALTDRRRALAVGCALFALALAPRVLLWVASPDRQAPFSALYGGDAAVWVDYANGLEARPERDFGRLLRPPGMGFLLWALWGGESSFGGLRLLWCALGALLAPLCWLGLRRGLGARTALGAGVLVALASGPILLSSSLNNETPYLVLVAAGFVGFDRLRERGSLWRAAVFGALSGLACLVRAEHALVTLLCVAWLAVGWRRSGPVRSALRLGALAFAFALVLLPWHLSLWRGIERFNGDVVPPLPRTVLAWDADARAALAELPGFAQAASAGFVEATVRHRGGARVGRDDLAILEQAYGYRPAPLAAHPFVAAYGPLNFWLANHPRATGGFTREPLAEPPPLAGGASRYAPEWLANLPLHGTLAPEYPPHLRALVDGYALGIGRIADAPFDWLSLCARKLAIAWSGAAHGFGASAVPLGLGGLRRRVDLVVPQGAFAWAWRIGLLLTALFGVRAAARHASAVPWLLFALAQIAIAAAFFGYARHGAMLAPAVAVCVVCAAARWRVPRAALVGVGVVALVLAVDAWHALAPRAIVVDGRAVGPVDPWPVHEFEDRVVEVR
jgi:hypothetical protein